MILSPYRKTDLHIQESSQVRENIAHSYTQHALFPKLTFNPLHERATLSHIT